MARAVEVPLADRWLCARDAAKELGISLRSFYEHVAKRASVVRRYVGTKPVWSLASLNRYMYLEASHVPAGAPAVGGQPS